ncbi:hypothetical protein GCM10010466_68710 [Planomonospora alba]|uniref:Uncharacterized protein n=1 Tax=Planomonospora alba TaxID=161354 RepID=A0ABP6P7E9_9ACTN
MLDLDAKTFADLTGGKFNPDTLGVDGNGGKGHIKVTYVITKWGKGVGKKNKPVPFATGAWSEKDTDPAEPVVLKTAADKAAGKAAAAGDTAVKAAAAAPQPAVAARGEQAGGPAGVALAALIVAGSAGYVGHQVLTGRIAVKRG